MNWFPSLDSGAVSQFPMTRSRGWRVIENQFEGGERIQTPDPSAGTIQWRLVYNELSAAEMAAIKTLFEASKGSFLSFGFVDPMVNLLAQSENLSAPDWRLGAMSAQTGIDNPLGSTSAWRVSNSATGSQELAQTLSCPGSIRICFSGYFRASSAGTIQLGRDGLTETFPIGLGWRRLWISGAGDGNNMSNFSVVLQPGQVVDIWGLQAEVQPSPSMYQKTLSAGGIYQNTRFSSDELRVMAAAPGLYSCDVNLISKA